MSTPIELLKGVNGQIEVYPDRIIIKRKGFRSKMTQGFFQGEKTIFIRQLTSIKVKQAGLLTNGFIQFTLAGNLEHKRGLLKQTQDENTVFFSMKQNDLVREIKEYIEQAMASVNNGQSIASNADEITKYKKLLDDGILTKEEFEAKKKQLLDI